MTLAARHLAFAADAAAGGQHLFRGGNSGKIAHGAEIAAQLADALRAAAAWAQRVFDQFHKRRHKQRRRGNRTDPHGKPQHSAPAQARWSHARHVQ